MSQHTPVLECLSTTSGHSPKAQKYLRTFIRRLVENPSAVTIQEVSIVSSLVAITPEDLFLIALCWSEVDVELEKKELGLSDE